MTTDNQTFKLPADISLGPVKLQVADLSRSIDYYTKILSLNVLQNSGNSAVLGYSTSAGTGSGRDVGAQAAVPRDGVSQTAASRDAVPQTAVPPDAVPQDASAQHAAQLPKNYLPATNGSLVELIEHPGATPVPRNGRLGLYHFAILLPDRKHLGAMLEHLGALNQNIGMADHAVSEAIYLTDPDGLGIEVYSDRPRSEWKTVGDQIYMVTEHLDVMNLVTAARESGIVWNGMPEGTKMGHIHLHVGNIGRGARLYHEIMGFEKTVWDYPGALFMSAGGYHHHLAINTWARGAPEPSPDDAQLLEWHLIVPSIQDINSIENGLAQTDLPVEFVREGSGDLRVKNQWGTWARVGVAPS